LKVTKDLTGYVCAFTGGGRSSDGDTSIDQDAEIEFPYDKGAALPEFERSINLVLNLVGG
jgi:hypothetical protein